MTLCSLFLTEYTSYVIVSCPFSQLTKIFRFFHLLRLADEIASPMVAKANSPIWYFQHIPHKHIGVDFIILLSAKLLQHFTIIANIHNNVLSSHSPLDLG